MKRFSKLLIGGSLILTMGMSAAAYNYNLPIDNPFFGSLESTPDNQAATSSPFVNPSIASAPTGYFLSPQRQTSIKASNVKTATTPGRMGFTYASGYGGSGTKYYLSAFPTEANYNDYVVYGTWSP